MSAGQVQPATVLMRAVHGRVQFSVDFPLLARTYSFSPAEARRLADRYEAGGRERRSFDLLSLAADLREVSARAESDGPWLRLVTS